MGGVEVDSTQEFSAAANHCSQHFCSADCINFSSAVLSLRVASGVMGRVEKREGRSTHSVMLCHTCTSKAVR